MDSSQTEPAKQTGAQGVLVGLIVAAAALGAAFGLDLSKGQIEAILGFVAACFAAAPYLTALVIRAKVYSPATVRALVSQAHAAGKTGQAPPKV